MAASTLRASIPLVAAKPDVADPARVLQSVAEAANPSEALRGFNPPHKGYAQLRAKLAELRQASDMAERGPIPYGPALKPGMRDARVPLVRARFGLDIPASEAREDHLVYDTQVAGAVADYQRHHGLPASGVLTTRTVASLSGGNPKRLESEIVANMERWRWLAARSRRDSYVAVNIPDFSLDVVKDDMVVHHARVVVGKPDHQTPRVFRGDEIHHRQSLLERAAFDREKGDDAEACRGPELFCQSRLRDRRT